MNTASGQTARAVEQDQRPSGIDREIRVRIAGGPVVRRLRGGVHDQPDLAAVQREERLHGGAVADVGRGVPIPGTSLEPSRTQAVDASGPKNTDRMSLSTPTTS
jgi:hypothetical protein